MATEIELKARVKDKARLVGILARNAVLLGTYDKADLYFAASEAVSALPPKSAFRLRKDGASWTVTHKTKNFAQGVEVNEETEFEVSDAAAFQKMMAALGFREL